MKTPEKEKDNKSKDDKTMEEVGAAASTNAGIAANQRGEDSVAGSTPTPAPSEGNPEKKSAPTVAIEKAAEGANAGTAEARIDASADAASRSNEAAGVGEAQPGEASSGPSLEDRVTALEDWKNKVSAQLKHWV